MQIASEEKDLDGIIQQVSIVEKSQNDLMPILENSIQNLPVPEGDTTCQ